MQQETSQFDFERIYQAFTTLSNELPRLLNPNTINAVQVMNNLKMDIQNLRTQQTAFLEERFEKLQNNLDLLNARLGRFEELLLRLPIANHDVGEKSVNIVHVLEDDTPIRQGLTHFPEPDIPASVQADSDRNDDPTVFDQNFTGVTVGLITPPVSKIGGGPTVTRQQLAQDSQQVTGIALQTDSNRNFQSSIEEALIAPNQNPNEVTGEENDYNIDDIVLANVQGYPPWPGRLLDPEHVPGALIHERPLTSSKVYYVHLWVSAKNLSLLQKHDIEAYIKKPHNSSVELLKAYQTALDPSSWEASLPDLSISTRGVKGKKVKTM
ncbi:hypothetical protein Clacol_001045 [Clathrus columnatus]|uniref:PWWP domain-containing protein n=1 Tax=Clathrus columnatus TaxID=1419009 RepID=A0AAV5A285_9AGAM|nr:hypothetical protein Clacol_001045 [Clathrus columnatus]